MSFSLKFPHLKEVKVMVRLCIMWKCTFSLSIYRYTIWTAVINFCKKVSVLHHPGQERQILIKYILIATGLEIITGKVMGASRDPYQREVLHGPPRPALYASWQPCPLGTGQCQGALRWMQRQGWSRSAHQLQRCWPSLFCLFVGEMVRNLWVRLKEGQKGKASKKIIF